MTSTKSAMWRNTPLSEAVLQQDPERLAVLAQNPDLLHQPLKDNGEQAIHLACVLGFVDAARILLDAGADPEAAPTQPLILAVQHEQPGILDLLLTAGARPDVRDERWMTPLMHACLLGSPALASRLVSHGAELSLHNMAGAQAIHLAAAFGPPDTVACLLAAGADPMAINRKNQKTPIDFARAEQRSESLVILERYRLAASVPEDARRRTNRNSF